MRLITNRDRPSRFSFWARLVNLEVNLVETQEEVDGLTTTVGDIKTNVAASKQAALEAVEALEKRISEGTPANDLDFTKLTEAINELDADTKPASGGTSEPAKSGEDAARGSV